MQAQSNSVSESLIKRNQLQSQAKQAYINTVLTDKPYHIAFYVGTGIGKTKTAIDCARWYYDNITHNNPESRTLIVCHAEIGRDDIWPEELEKWAVDHEVSNAERICYQSLPKIKKQRFDVVILDEAHYLTARSAVFFENNIVKSLIILTATEPRDDIKKARLKKLVGNNHLDITADDAIEQGILNDYSVHVFRMKLNNTVPYVPQWTNGPLLTERDAYLHHMYKITLAQEQNRSTKFHYIELMRFMGNCTSKLRCTEWIRDQLRGNNRRFIIFSPSVAAADFLSPYTYHSLTDDTHYRAFKAGEINELASVKQIQEGANIPNLDRAIVPQLDTNPLNMIQKIGRLLRKKVGEKTAILLIVAESTYDEYWCKKALSKTPKHKIAYRDIPESAYKL